MPARRFYPRIADFAMVVPPRCDVCDGGLDVIGNPILPDDEPRCHLPGQQTIFDTQPDRAAPSPTPRKTTPTPPLTWSQRDAERFFALTFRAFDFDEEAAYVWLIDHGCPLVLADQAWQGWAGACCVGADRGHH